MRKNIFLAAIMMGWLIIAAACSESREILGQIPGDSQSVARINAKTLLEQAGCTVDDDDITLSNKLESLVQDNDYVYSLGMISSLSGYIDIENVFAFVPKGAYQVWFVSEATDADGLRTFLKEEKFQESKIEEFEVYSAEDFGVIYLDGNIAWIQPQLDLKQTPADFRNDAVRNGSVGDIPGTGDFLRKEGMARLACRSEMDEDDWICFDLKLDGPSITAEITVIDKNGTIAAPKGLSDIDMKFLGYIPADPFAVMALGLNKDVDWNAIGTIVGNIGGLQANIAYETILPTLKAIDGTFAIAVQYTGDEPLIMSNFRDFKMVLLGQMAAKDGVATIAGIKNLTSELGLSTTSTSPENLALRYGGMTFHACYTDGFLILSNYEVEPGSNASLDGFFKNRKLGGFVTFTKEELSHAVTEEMPFGIDIDFSVVDNKATVTLRLTEEKAPFIPALLNLMPDDSYSSEE